MDNHNPKTLEPAELPAGAFSVWLRQLRNVLRQDSGAEVPCGACNVCCRSSYFIHIRPAEQDTLAHIPKGLLFAAPFQPQGNVVMGYDQSGCCPMLADNQCSIYRHRPQTCRNYDCRIFAATGMSAGDASKALITRQAGRWRFSYPTPDDRAEQRAVQVAAGFLTEQATAFPMGTIPGNETQLAIMAIKVYPVFLTYGQADCGMAELAPAEMARRVLEELERFEAAGKSPRL